MAFGLCELTKKTIWVQFKKEYSKTIYINKEYVVVLSDILNKRRIS